MNPKEEMFLIKNEIKTQEIASYKYNPQTEKIDITFKNGKTYSYSRESVEVLTHPEILNPVLYQISTGRTVLYKIKEIYRFQSTARIYYHICFEENIEKDYLGKDLTIKESCLCGKKELNLFNYIKAIAELNDLKYDIEEGKDIKILQENFNKIGFIGKDVAMAKYLNPSSEQKKNVFDGTIIFPFGSNNSQFSAVRNALENQISIIEGPPGTGKTQTILNIIANLLVQGKTVQIVSNNNSATDNVYEKLLSSGLDFVVAKLGSSERKKAFLEEQKGEYPDFSSWIYHGDINALQSDISEGTERQKEIFDRQEDLAKIKLEFSNLKTEYEHFKKHIENLGASASTNTLKIRKHLSAKDLAELWQRHLHLAEKNKKAGLLFRLFVLLRYGISDPKFYKQDISKIIITFQTMFYREKYNDLINKINNTEDWLKDKDKFIVELKDKSMILLKNYLAKKYDGLKKRPSFEYVDFLKNPENILKEYPVVLSTTFSSKNSLSKEIVFDYLIMDEASQVDIATASLALSCAKNIVIVGDTKQLPNVISEETKSNAEKIFNSFNIDNDGYRYTKSFLQSMLDVMPNVAHTRLREHYRCHPKIINFCNQKFYNGELIIMTDDNDEEDVLAAIRTVPGNHARQHYNQRQIDVIREEIIPKYAINKDETGIISPYNDQINALEKEFPDIDVKTVHKFQGREKDTIIISTVDDIISDFADDPYLLNVAVSRAKKKLMLVVTGNQQIKERNIIDLVNYIKYNNFEVSDSKVQSVFDYLYKQYGEERKTYLKKHRRISEYESENLMYALIEDALSSEKYSSIGVICHFPLCMLIKDTSLLNERGYTYVMNPSTHVDFLLYNKITKKHVFALEVDGYLFHKSGTKQASRDLLKNHILEAYGIPLIRLSTNGSNEKEKLMTELDKIAF